MAQTADVFLSYSREDKARVLDLAARLRAAGVNIWIDQGGIDGAALWGESIVRALEGAKVLLLMVTPSAVSSHNVTNEVMLTSNARATSFRFISSAAARNVRSRRCRPTPT